MWCWLKTGVQRHFEKCGALKKLPWTQWSDNSLPPSDEQQRTYQKTGELHPAFRGLLQMTRQSIARSNLRHISDTQHILGPLWTYKEKKMESTTWSCLENNTYEHCTLLMRCTLDCTIVAGNPVKVNSPNSLQHVVLYCPTPWLLPSALYLGTS